MKISKTLAAVALLSFLGTAGCDGEAETDPAPADAPSPPGAGAEPGAVAPQQEMDPETMALMMEMQELQQQLAPIQEEAMQDEALAGRLDEIQERIETAMRDEDPELFEQMERLEADFMAAQEAGDQERAQEVGMEAQGLQMELQALQSAVLDHPDLQEPIEAFRAAQRDRMMEIDPEAGELLDRMDEILEEMESH